jgi:hypothetical protein
VEVYPASAETAAAAQIRSYLLRSVSDLSPALPVNSSPCLVPFSPRPKEVNPPAIHNFPNPAEKVGVRQDVGAKLERISK